MSTPSSSTSKGLRLIVKTTPLEGGTTVRVDTSGGLADVIRQINSLVPFDVERLFHVIYNNVGDPIKPSSIESVNVLEDFDVVIATQDVRKSQDVEGQTRSSHVAGVPRSSRAVNCEHVPVNNETMRNIEGQSRSDPHHEEVPANSDSTRANCEVKNTNGASTHHENNVAPRLAGRKPISNQLSAVLGKGRKQDWLSVLDSVIKYPQLACGEVLHHAIAGEGDCRGREQVIVQILSTAPQAASFKSPMGLLPLHAIVHQKSKMDHSTKENLVNMLISAYNAALTIRGGATNRTPLHISLTKHGSVKLVRKLVESGRKACSMPDSNGYLPAHIACRNNCAVDTLKLLLEAYPKALHAKTGSDENLINLARSSANAHAPNRTLIAFLEQQSNPRKRTVEASSATKVSAKKRSVAKENIVPANNISTSSVAEEEVVPPKTVSSSASFHS